jgi:hypothetical protein
MKLAFFFSVLGLKLEVAKAQRLKSNNKITKWIYIIKTKMVNQQNL